MASHIFCVLVLMSIAAVILAKPADSDPPPLDCPENEVYYKCELEVCYKNCQHLKRPPPCPILAPGCVAQACLCKYGYLRNNEGVCIPEDQCECK